MNVIIEDCDENFTRDDLITEINESFRTEFEILRVQLMDTLVFDNLDKLDADQLIITRMRNMQYMRKTLRENVKSFIDNMHEDIHEYIKIGLIRSFIKNCVNNSIETDSSIFYYYKREYLNDPNLICYTSYRYNIIHIYDLTLKQLKVIHTPDNNFVIHPYTNNIYTLKNPNIVIFDDNGKFMTKIPLKKDMERIKMVALIEKEYPSYILTKGRNYSYYFNSNIPPADKLFIFACENTEKTYSGTKWWSGESLTGEIYDDHGKFVRGYFDIFLE